MKFKTQFYLTDLFLALIGAIAGLSSQDIWFQKICVSNHEVLKIGSCKIYQIRFLLGALLGAAAWVLVRMGFETYCKDTLTPTTLPQFRKRVLIGLSPLILTVLSPFFQRPPALLPSLVGASLIMATLLNFNVVYESVKKRGVSVWTVLIINSLITLFASDLVFGWIGYQKLSMTFPSQFIFHNFILVLFVTASVYFFTNRALLSSVFSFFTFSILNFSAGQKLKFLGLPLYPWDLQMTGEGTAIIRNIWDSHASIAVLGFAGVLAFIAFFTLKASPVKTSPLKKRSYFWGATTLAAALVVSNQTLSAEEIFPDFHGVRNTQLDKGAAYFLTLAYKVGRNKAAPEGYSKEAIEKIVSDVKINQSNLKEASERSNLVDRPNVIFYMIESFIDPTEMGVRYKNDPLPFFHSLKKNSSYGHMAVSIYGGGTANTEFEIMTGMSISNLLPGILAYYQLSGKTPSLAWLFKDAGYETFAFNGWSRTAFNWDKVYPSMGVDHFTAMNEDLPHSPELYGLYSDEGIVDLVLDADRKTDKPVFVAVVTNSTHIPYEKRIPYNPEFEVLNTELSTKSKDVFSKYAEVVHHTDIAFKRLIESLSKSKKKNILIAYGDHLPGITYAYDELSYFKTNRKERMHQVPLLIWNNFESKKEDLFLSANFLGIKILNILDVKKRGHFELIEPLAQKTQVVTHAFQNIPQTREIQPLLKNYELIQYDLMGGKNYLKSLIDTAVK